MKMFTWDNALAVIREGTMPIPTDPDGVPLIAANNALFELMELMEAVTTGYNAMVERAAKDQKRIEFYRKLADARFPASPKNTYTWVRVEDRLPEKSGNYYTFGTSLGVHPLSYSALYKMWNTRDYATKESALETAITEVTHWCEIPAPPVIPEPILHEED